MRLDGLAFWTALLATCPVAVFAQHYPTKPIRIIAQFQPGTSTDI